VIGGVLYARNQATTLIEELRALDTAANPSAFVLAFMGKYRAHFVDKNCRADWCQYHFLFTNAAISKLHLVPRAEIRTYLTLNRGALAIVYVEYTSAVFKADSPIVGVQEDFCAIGGTPPCNYFYLDPHGWNVAQTWKGTVTFGQMATQEQRGAAWALNSNCFTALKGCKDISELLPRIWKLTSLRAVTSRMRSMADSIADASQPLPE
jgi:hypothetical protein